MEGNFDLFWRLIGADSGSDAQQDVRSLEGLRREGKHEKEVRRREGGREKELVQNGAKQGGAQFGRFSREGQAVIRSQWNQ